MPHQFNNPLSLYTRRILIGSSHSVVGRYDTHFHETFWKLSDQKRVIEEEIIDIILLRALRKALI